jgi:hypothetical protein
MLAMVGHRRGLGEDVRITPAMLVGMSYLHDVRRGLSDAACAEAMRTMRHGSYPAIAWALMCVAPACEADRDDGAILAAHHASDAMSAHDAEKVMRVMRGPYDRMWSHRRTSKDLDHLLTPSDRCLLALACPSAPVMQIDAAFRHADHLVHMHAHAQEEQACHPFRSLDDARRRIAQVVSAACLAINDGALASMTGTVTCSDRRVWTIGHDDVMAVPTPDAWSRITITDGSMPAFRAAWDRADSDARSTIITALRRQGTPINASAMAEMSVMMHGMSDPILDQMWDHLDAPYRLLMSCDDPDRWGAERWKRKQVMVTDASWYTVISSLHETSYRVHASPDEASPFPERMRQTARLLTGKQENPASMDDLMRIAEVIHRIWPRIPSTPLRILVKMVDQAPGDHRAPACEMRHITAMETMLPADRSKHDHGSAMISTAMIMGIAQAGGHAGTMREMQSIMSRSRNHGPDEALMIMRRDPDMGPRLRAGWGAISDAYRQWVIGWCLDWLRRHPGKDGHGMITWATRLQEWSDRENQPNMPW